MAPEATPEATTASGSRYQGYVATVNYLSSPEFAAIAAEKKRHSPLMALAILLVLIGLFAFFSVLLRLL